MRERGSEGGKKINKLNYYQLPFGYLLRRRFANAVALFEKASGLHGGNPQDRAVSPITNPQCPIPNSQN